MRPCPYGPVCACLVSAFWDGSRQGALLKTLGNWYATAVGGLSTPRGCLPIVRGTPTGGGGIRVYHGMPAHLLQGHSCPKKCKVWHWGEGLAAGWCNLDPVGAALPHPPQPWSQCWSGLIWSSTRGVTAAAAAICPRSLWNSFSGIAVLPLNKFKKFNTNRTGSSVRRGLFDQIHLHTENRDPLHLGEFALFAVDPKTQLS